MARRESGRERFTKREREREMYLKEFESKNPNAGYAPIRLEISFILNHLAIVVFFHNASVDGYFKSTTLRCVKGLCDGSSNDLRADNQFTQVYIQTAK